MKAAFHYIVKAKLIRKIQGKEIAFEEINKKFENQTLIVAREEAFRYYQSWIDILLQHKGKEYVSDKEARKDLISFIAPGQTTKLIMGDKVIEFTAESFGNGIGVYFVANEQFNRSNFAIGEEALIHGIGNFGGISMHHDPFFNLIHELEYYKYYNYETRNKEIEITYCVKDAWQDGCEDAAIIKDRILETPFDWEGYDKPYWWGGPIHKDADPIPKTIEEIIHQGESNQVEFKTTLHFKNRKGIIKIKEDIAKTICGFLNSNGGILFIGINDNKEVQGLDFDFSLSNGKNPKDYFQIEFDNMQEQFIGLSIKSNISGQFYELKGKEVYCITVSRSRRRLIFLKGQEGNELYVRGEASTRQLKDPEEIINYWNERHFGNEP